MNRNKKWLLAVGVAAMITANGIAMAAVTPAQLDGSNGKQHAAFDKGDFKGKGFKEDYSKLIELLKIDEKTFKAEMKEGKTLVAIAKEHGVSEKALKDFLVKQMTQRMDEGVKAGRITADQAKKMKADMSDRVSQMINGKGPMHHGPRAGHAPFENAKLLELLKIDAETLKNEIKSEKTLVAIAGEHGVSEQALKDFMVVQMTERMEEGVKAGRITADQAEKMKARMEERVSKMINSKGPMHHGPRAGHAPFENAKLLELLKIDAATLKNEIKSDKTLVAIAGEHGVSEQELKDFLTEQMTQRIEEGVKAGRITADQAEKMKSNMADRVSKMINGKGAMHRGHGPMSGQEKQANS
ncbi:hypothetical protein [Sporomusa sp.]|uniref:hypothetical protein n=1 Tax=Sporomusa sp. TaxID=2078658 RepID=UPI002BF094E8|nr:hypothetical protein [Sporomusa sp.]HWR43609.1 hypothetical protein [Sporomusa sp.]